jgi:hypothetical protein
MPPDDVFPPTASQAHEPPSIEPLARTLFAPLPAPAQDADPWGQGAHVPRAVSQYVPPGHVAFDVHPMQKPLAVLHVVRARQLAFDVHPTQKPRVVSQTGVAPLHCASVVHAAVHPKAGLHRGVAPPQSVHSGPHAAAVVHGEQLPPGHSTASKMPPGHPCSSPTMSPSRIRCVFEVPQRSVTGVEAVIPALARSDSDTPQSTKKFGVPPRLLGAGLSRALVVIA